MVKSAKAPDEVPLPEPLPAASTYVYDASDNRTVPRDRFAVATMVGSGASTSGSSAPTISYLIGHQTFGAEINGNFQFFLPDALGTVRDVVDDAGDVLQSYEFNEHGIPMPGSGAGTGTFSPKTYQGGLSVNDDRNDSGLYLMGHRHYAADLGRFISRDPIGFRGGLNLFGTRFGNNPVTFVDPGGLKVTTTVSDPGFNQAFQKALSLAISRTKEHSSCPTSGSWPGSSGFGDPSGNAKAKGIDYLEALEGNWDVEFSFDVRAEARWQTKNANQVMGIAELVLPVNGWNDNEISNLADVILHELTHAGIYRNYDKLSTAEKSQCRAQTDEWGEKISPAYDPRLVGPEGPPIGDHTLTHPALYFQDGIYQHLRSGGG